MAVILTVGGTQLHYAQGTWPRATMHNEKWKFSLIPDSDYTAYQGKYLVSTIDIGGFFFGGAHPPGTINLYDENNVEVWFQQITFSASQVVTITLDHPNREVTIEGATTGNGTYSYTTSVDIFADAQLDVGANPQDIYHFEGVITDFEDFSGGDQTVEPAGIPSEEAFGAPSVALDVAPAGIASAEAFGTPSVALQVAPVGIPSGATFGAPSVALQAAPAGIPSGEAFGTPSVAQGVVPTAIASAEAFGSPVVTADATVAPTSIPSAEAFGAPMVVADAVVAPTGIASAEAFGAPTVVADAVIAPSGIASAEALGAPSVELVVAPTGIESGEELGSPVVALDGPISDPSQVEGLLKHHIASSGVVESGGIVSEWLDQSVNGYDHVQLTEGNRPTKPSGEDRISFAGSSSQFLVGDESCAALFGGKPFIAAYLVECAAFAAGGTPVPGRRERGDLSAAVPCSVRGIGS